MYSRKQTSVNRKFFLAFVLGEIIILFGTSCAADCQVAEDYSVNNVPGSPGKSSGISKIETDIKMHREATRDANDANQEAIATYGRNSPEAKKTGRNLNKKHTQLERTLYQDGQLPGATNSNPGASNGQVGNSRRILPIRQVEF